MVKPPRSKPAAPFALALTAFLFSLALLPACTSLGLNQGGELRAVAANGSASFTPAPTIAAYSWVDENTADVYLTDLPFARLADAKDTLADVSGTIIHVHLFLVPSAGSTPIDSTACNAAVRLAVISQGAAGVYSGGGFLFPVTNPSGVTAATDAKSGEKRGSDQFDANLRGSSLRLSHAGPAFADKLGSMNLSGRISATRDTTTSAAIAGRLAAMVNSLPARTAGLGQ